MKNRKLHHIKSHGFKVPKDYFNAFEENLLNRIEEEAHLPKTETGFKVPNGYFNAIEDNVLQKLSEETKTKVISLFNKKTIVYISSVAAAILLLFNLSIFEKTPSFDNLETETVETYILNENISSYEIASLFTDTELNDNNFVDHNLDAENIEEYLLNNADIEALLIE
jgi:uncharacterized membrane protein YvbJ